MSPFAPHIILQPSGSLAKRLVMVALKALLVIAIVCSSGCGVANRLSARRLVNEGQRALDREDPVEAQHLFIQALVKRPTYARAWYYEGNLALEADEFSRAADFFREALRLDPDHVSAWHRLGFALLRTNQLEEAEYAFRRAIDLETHFSPSHFGLGVIYDQINRPDEARRSYLRALRNQPDHENIHKKLSTFPPAG